MEYSKNFISPFLFVTTLMYLETTKTFVSNVSQTFTSINDV